VYPAPESTGCALMAGPDDGEMRTMNARERVAKGKSLEGFGDLIDGDVDRLATVLADEVLMIDLRAEVDDRRTVTEMDMVENAESLENVDGSVDRRLVDVDGRALLGPPPNLRSIEMLTVACCEHSADRTACRSDAHAF